MNNGDFIKKYKIISILGEGGMGIVYRARDTELNRDVAIKCIAPHLIKDSTIRKRFIREARIHANLNHQNICIFYDAFEEDGMLFTVIELLHGETLNEKIQKNGALTTKDIKFISDGVLNGLGYLHSKEIIHRDIKPSNIFITNDEKIKLMDLGIARAFEDSATSLTQSKQSIGTPTYMSPEQIKGEKITAVTDIYSFGMTLFEMLTGQLPFDDTSSNYKIYDFHVRGRVPSVFSKNPKANKKLAAIATKALSKAPGKRFANAKQIQKAIKTTFVKPISSIRSQFSTPWIVVATFVATLLIAMIGFMIFSKITQDSTPKPHTETHNRVSKTKYKNTKTVFSQNTAITLKVEAEDALKELADKKFVLFKKEKSDANKLFRIGNEAKNSLNYSLACNSFIKVTNIFAKVKIRNDYFNARQKYETELKKADKYLLDKFAGNYWKQARINEELAKNNSENYLIRTKNYKSALSFLLNAVTNAKKIKYDELMTKAVDCYQQKMWTDAKAFAEQAKKSGYKDVSAATTLLIKIKKLFQPVKGKNFSLPISDNVNLEFVWIKPGTFKMGSNENSDEKPVHNVRINNGFWMGKYEVTQKQYQEIMGKNPSILKKSGENAPVENVSWNDCKEFCKKFSEKTGLKIRLPSEAEWEYACRADSTTKYYNGNDESDLKNVGWYNGNSGKQTHPVGRKVPNNFGLYDMHGNVWEWCEDWWNGSYKGAPDDGSPWRSGNSSYRVLRGGCWCYDASYCRAALRFYYSPEGTLYNCGFRVVVAFL